MVKSSVLCAGIMLWTPAATQVGGQDDAAGNRRSYPEHFGRLQLRDVRAACIS